MTDIANLTLILGGARSGKTARALALCEAAAPRRAYLATAQAFDAEMADRIDRHKAERGAGWRTVEEPIAAAEAVAACPAAEAVLLDCLTLWLSNLMHANRETEGETARLLAAVAARGGPVVMVSNEVGLGIVPETPLGRRFRDAQGRLNQAVAARAASVEFVAAGLPLRMKG